MWIHFEETKKQCLLLEKTLSELPGENFPIIVGRRTNVLTTGGKENIENLNVNVTIFPCKYIL